MKVSSTTTAIVVMNLEDFCGQIGQVYLSIWQLGPPGSKLT